MNRIFRHWPPLVRAYRQNLTGLEPDKSTRRYIKWGSIGLIAIFSVAWFIYYLPYFQHQANIGLFAYTSDFVRPFFDGSTAPMVSEFLWRFVAQFYLNVPLTIAVVTLMVIGFCITSRRTAGPYMPLLLPLFFLLFVSPDPFYASSAVSLWLNMGALSLYFVMSRYSARHPRAWGPMILMHLYAGILAAVLYYATGHWALLFCISVVVVHLLAVPMTLGDKEPGLGRIVGWNLLISTVVNLAVSFLLWNVVDFAPYHFPWYVWVALGVFILGCIPGLVLQAYNNRKVFIFEWKKRKGREQEAQLTLVPHYHIPISLITLVIGAVLVFVLPRNPLERSWVKVQNYVTEGDYTRSLKQCERYFEKFAEPSEKQMADEEFQRRRHSLASYYKLSLLMKGRLDNDFLALAYQYPEMAWMYPAPLPFVGAFDYSYIKVYQELGLAAPAVPQVLSCIELFGLQNRFVEPLLWAQKASGQYRLMLTSLYYARKSFYSRELYFDQRDDIEFLASEYQKAERERLANGTESEKLSTLNDILAQHGALDSSLMAEMAQADSLAMLAVDSIAAARSTNFARAALANDGSRPVPLSDSTLQPAGGFIDQWVKAGFEQRVFGGNLHFGRSQGTVNGQASVNGQRHGNISIERYVNGSLRPRYEKLTASTHLRLPQNRAILDYYSLMILMEKKLELMPYLLQIYNDMGVKVLPRYLQEAWCLYLGYPSRIDREQLLSKQYYDFHINSETVNVIDDVYRAYADLRSSLAAGSSAPVGLAGSSGPGDSQGTSSVEQQFQELTRRYSSTYVYHFLFGKQ